MAADEAQQRPWQRASDAEKAEGVTGQNNLAFEELNKPRYHLAAAADGDDAIDESFEIGVVDMSAVLRSSEEGGEAARAAFAAELGLALEEMGFAVLVGHGVDLALHEAAHARTPLLFTSNTDDRKAAFRAERFGAVNQGWFPMEETSNLHPDQVEGWVWCRRAFRLPGGLGDQGTGGSQLAEYWPSGAGEEEFWRAHVLAHERLAAPIFRAMLDRVGVAQPEPLVEALNEPAFALRLNYYPPATGDVGAKVMDQGAGRMVGHEDVDLFTLLPAPSSPGLQALNPRTQKWVRVTAPPGSIIVNTGDYAQRLFSDHFPSTTHRVTPPPEEYKAQPRTSFPMAVYLPEDFVLTCLPECGEPRYPPMTSLDFHTSTNRKYYGEDYRATGADGKGSAGVKPEAAVAAKL